MVLAAFMLLVLAFICRSVTLNDPEYDPNLFEGDMMLSPKQFILYRNGGMNPKFQLGASKLQKWPRIIPYDIGGTLNNSYATNLISEAIADYERLTCLKFEKRSTERDYMHFFKGPGCATYVGFGGGGKRKISLGAGCLIKGIIIHEMAHSLGFFHEQNRPDRDNYVTIVGKNILTGMGRNFKKETSYTVDSLQVPYDYDSIMHYSGYAFSKNGKKTIVTINSNDQSRIGQREGLSKLDVEQMNAFYECGNVLPSYTKRPIITQPTLITSKPTTRPSNKAYKISSACENESLNLNCSHNKKIDVSTGFYGFATHSSHFNYRSRCNKRTPTFAYCRSSAYVMKVYSKCKSTSSCSIIVNEKNLGYVRQSSPRYPCTGYTRYAYVKYKCT